VEDVGVVADEVVAASSTDLISQDYEQYASISERLIEAGAQRRSSVVFESSSADVPMGVPLEIKARWTHTSAIEFRKDGVVLGTITVPEDAPQLTTLSVPFVAPEVAASGRIEVLGLVDGEPVWRKFYQFRTVPASIVITPMGRLFSDFSEGSPAHFTSYSSAPTEGWQVRDGALRVGPGPEYAHDLTTEASLFVTLPADSAMTFTANLEGATEKDYDFFRIVVVDAGKEMEVFATTSGAIPAIAHNVDLAPYAGKSIELRLEFTSDGAVSDVGPALDQFIIW
jgi:hypothetical protein